MSSHRELKRAAVRVFDEADWLTLVYRDGGDIYPALDRLTDAVQEYQAIASDLNGRGAANGRATSNIAAATTLPAKETARRAIIVTLVAHWRMFHTGMTIAELKGRLRKEHSTVSAALNFVMLAGWVRDSGETRNTQHGKPAIVWVPTEKAIAAVTDLTLGAA